MSRKPKSKAPVQKKAEAPRRKRSAEAKPVAKREKVVKPMAKAVPGAEKPSSFWRSKPTPEAAPVTPPKAAPGGEQSPAARLIGAFRAVAVEAVEKHDHAAAHRTRYDSLQSFNKADRFLLTAFGCYLADGERETLAEAAPWDDLFAKHTNRGKAKTGKGEK